MNALTFEMRSLCFSSARRIESFRSCNRPRGPGVRHIGEDLDAGVAEVGDLGDRVLDREVHVGVAGEGEFHAEVFWVQGSGGPSQRTNCDSRFFYQLGKHRVIRRPLVNTDVLSKCSDQWRGASQVLSMFVLHDSGHVSKFSKPVASLVGDSIFVSES